MQDIQTISALKIITKQGLPPWMKGTVFPILENTLRRNEEVAIAVSSGVDSMALACAVLLRYQEKQFSCERIHIIHCNHQLRRQSEKEENYIKRFFQGLDVHVFRREKSLKSDEASLRKRRYACFEEVCKESKSAFLLVGHHLEDRIESSLMNAIRGSGLKGFLNMKTTQKHQFLSSAKIHRPLLDISKQELVDFCEQGNISYFEDETNLDTTTSQRNRIRKQILNPLKELGTPESNHFLESLQHIYREIEELDEEEEDTLRTIPTFPSWESEFAYQWNKNLSNVTEKELLKLRDRVGMYYNIRSTQIQEWLKRIKETQAGRKQLKNTYFFIQDKQLFILKAKKGFWKAFVEEEQTVTKLGTYTIAGVEIIISEERLLGVTLRFPKKGDFFAGKTRNRRCLNQKIPVFWRNFIPLAEKGGKIIHMRKIYK